MRLQDLPLFSRPVWGALAEAEEIDRLRGQKKKILERLREGRATAWELSRLALNYRARISELRALGLTITVVELDRKSGRTVYELEKGEEKR